MGRSRVRPGCPVLPLTQVASSTARARTTPSTRAVLGTITTPSTGLSRQWRLRHGHAFRLLITVKSFKRYSPSGSKRGATARKSSRPADGGVFANICSVMGRASVPCEALAGRFEEHRMTHKSRSKGLGIERRERAFARRSSCAGTKGRGRNGVPTASKRCAVPVCTGPGPLVNPSPGHFVEPFGRACPYTVVNDAGAAKKDGCRGSSA